MGSESDKRSRAAWELAGRQLGLVTRRQLLLLGFGSRSISHRLQRGRLHPVARGVYAVGWPYLDPRRRWMAAVLACGEGALLSHRSAAALWQFGVEDKRGIDVSVRRRCTIRRPGLNVRSRPSITAADVAVHDGVPVTCPARTLVDIASELGPAAVERAVNDADKRNLIDPEALRSALGDYSGQPGVRPLRALLDRLTFRLSDSDLEIQFRPIAAAAGLAASQSKVFVNGFEVDFFWPNLGLIVETDGLRYHRTPSAQARDALRDRTHAIAGMTPLRFTHFEICYQPREVRAELTAAATMLRQRIRV